MNSLGFEYLSWIINEAVDIKDVDCLKAMTQAEDELFCASFNYAATKLDSDSADHQTLYSHLSTAEQVTSAVIVLFPQVLET